MQPLVSVRVVTYNHEKYITQCLEGILMQKTDFPFEVIIGEDCSTDGTRQIVLSYEKRYPEKIKVLLPAQNLGSLRNSLQIQQTCQGKYQAMCEGDDYWIDPLKLQKQVNFMEAHPAVSLCYHNAFILDESLGVTRLFLETPVKEMLSFEDICPMTTPTASALARSEILATLPEWRLNVWGGDVLFRLWCAQHGSVGYLSDIMSVYRLHAGSMTSNYRSALEKHRSEKLNLYRQLDQDTYFQHTTAIQAQIKRVEEKYRRDTQGIFYYLMNPAKIFTRLQEYYHIVKQNRMIKEIGKS